MSVCTFFGHRDTPSAVKGELKCVLSELIEKEGVNSFLVGNEGNFDFMAKSVLAELKSVYSHINYGVVIAYLDEAKRLSSSEDVVFPEGLECVPKRFAVDYRNKWLLKQSDYVVSYVIKGFGGAAKFAGMAEKQGLTVINLSKQKT